MYPTKTKKPLRYRFLRRTSIVMTVFFSFYLGWAWLAVPSSAFSAVTETTTGQQPSPAQPLLTWPAVGQAAIGTKEFGVLATHGEQKAVPMASVAKVMTALSIMKKKPFATGSQGETITLTQADEQLYNKYLAKNGSVALVKSGEQISQYQALQALLLPSANNIADTLAVWAFGSVDAYADYANDYAMEMGLSDTNIADASGFDPATVSTAKDLIELGQKALQNEVISDIVSQKTATIPVAGTIRNVNNLLGTNGIVGIKTGNTDQAGGCLLFASRHVVSDHTVTIIGVVLGSPTRNESFVVSSNLLASAKQNFKIETLANKNAQVARYTLPWGESATAHADDNLQAISWASGRVSTHISLDKVTLPARSGQIVGKFVATSSATQTRNSVPLVLRGDIKGPSWWWRVTHPADTWEMRFTQQAIVSRSE